LWRQGIFATSAAATYLLFEGVRGGTAPTDTEGEMALDDLSIVTYCAGGGKGFDFLILTLHC
jgi:hypothetical protein